MPITKTLILNKNVTMENVTNAYNISKGLPVYTSWVPAGLQFFFGLLGNGLALFLLFRTRHVHRWNSFYRLYSGLALTDFSMIGLVYPFVMARYGSGFTWSITVDAPGLCEYMSFLWMWGFMSSGLIICAMCVDRFRTTFVHSVIIDRSYGSSSKKYTTILAGIWIFSAVIGILPIVGVGHNDTFYPGSWCFLDFACGQNDQHVLYGIKAISYIYSVIGLSVYAVTALVNLATLVAVCWQNSRTGILYDAKMVAGENEYFILLFLTVVFISFTALWLPLMLVVFLHAIGFLEGEGDRELGVLRLCIANTVIDPWLYIMTQKEILRSLRRLYKRGNSEEEKQILRAT